MGSLQSVTLLREICVNDRAVNGSITARRPVRNSTPPCKKGSRTSDFGSYTFLAKERILMNRTAYLVVIASTLVTAYLVVIASTLLTEELMVALA